MDLATLSGYVLSVATFRVLARDCVSPSLLSGPPCFSSAPMSFFVCCVPCSLPSALRWNPAASCGQPGGVATGGSVGIFTHTHSEHCWGTSCWAGPWLAASTGPSLPAGIHRLVGEADIVDVCSALHSQPPLTCSPAPLLYLCHSEKR